MRSRLRVVYFGRGDYFAATFLDAIELDHDLVGIVEARPGQSHAPSLARSCFDALRGRTSLRLRARRRRIPYVYWSPGGTLEDLLIHLEPDAGCIASFPRLLPERIFGRFRLGVLNYHPSLLPAYRGPLPLLWQYFFEEAQMGVSVHLIDAGEDTGDIVAQQALPVAFGEPLEHVERRFAAMGAVLMRDALGRLVAGNLAGRPQRHLSCPFRARILRPKERLIDWHTWSIERAYHFLRGAAPALEQTPQPGFPFDLLDWRPDSLEKSDGAATLAGTIGRVGYRFFVHHPEGRIWLSPHFGLTFLRRALRRRLLPGV